MLRPVSASGVALSRSSTAPASDREPVPIARSGVIPPAYFPIAESTPSTLGTVSFGLIL